MAAIPEDPPRKNTVPIRAVLTERDVALLRKLHELRYLSVRQVERLFFCSQQTAIRRLRILTQAGYLSTFQALGMPTRMVGLKARGMELVAEDSCAPISSDRLKNSGRMPEDSLFLKHFVAITEIRIALEAACRENTDLHILGFIPEYFGRRRADGTVSKYIRQSAPASAEMGSAIAHTPDGVFALERQGAAALFFLEVDRGTEVIGNPSRGVLKMVHFYLQHLVTGGFQRYQADFGVAEPFRGFRALLATTSRERLDNIRQVGGRIAFEPVSAKRFIWLTTLQQVETAGILGPIWRSLDPGDATEYGLHETRRKA